MTDNAIIFTKESLKEHDENLIEEFVKIIEKEMPYDICDGNEAIDAVYQIAKAFNRWRSKV